MPPFLTEKPEGILIKVFIQPRSSKNEIVGIHGGALKVKLTAPPVNGAANKMCIAFFAKCLKTPKSILEIVSGHSARSKSVLINLPDEKTYRQERRRVIRFFSLFSS